ncbi:para-nitrobenzyl esterase-like [Branchiostoma floridae]|uniref:Para-nitrobenzyl esterase-like n=1 Tax=Branchiostoma floridae TaxID=7739 RepID=A0A9J7LCS9_BRAFL|nr:para-nitrobenzyl esterase-like [Branchiostoma floridae]
MHEVVGFQFVYFFCTFLPNESGGNAHPVVTMASGKVRGMVQYTNDLPDKPVYTFKGIPYAAPPVGDLRFRAPQPAAPWEGVRDATELGPFCPQDMSLFALIPTKLPHTITDEDCLTVNIDTPTLEGNARLPVLLWIHGGGLILGMGEQFPYTSGGSPGCCSRNFQLPRRSVRLPQHRGRQRNGKCRVSGPSELNKPFQFENLNVF